MLHAADGDVTVVGSEPTGDVEHYELRLPDDGVVSVDVLPSDVDGAECQRSGWSLFVHRDRQEGGDPAKPLPAAFSELCDRVGRRGPPTIGWTARHDVTAIKEDEAFWWRPEHGLVAAVFAGALAALAFPVRRALAVLDRPERIELAAVTVLGAVLRLLLSPETVFNGAGAAFEKLEYATGQVNPSLYGDGYPAFLGTMHAIFGLAPEVVFRTDLVLSMLVPPLMWAVGRHYGGRTAALAAGLITACLPVHLWTARTEAEHVLIVAMEAVAAASALGFASGGSPVLALLAAASTGIAVHARPDALPFAVVPPLLVAVEDRKRAAAVGALVAPIVAWRLWAMAGQPRQHVMDGGFDVGRLLKTLLMPRLGNHDVPDLQVVLDLSLTSPVVPLLAILGVRRGKVVAAWWAVVTLPILPKAWPLVDAVRLQLAGQLPIAVLAGLGVEALVEWRPVLRPSAPWLAGALALSAWATTPLLAHQAEWMWLEPRAKALPDGAVVLYDDVPHRSKSLASQLAIVAPQATWVAARAWFEHPDGQPLAFVGLSCVAKAAHVDPEVGGEACALMRSCHLVPVDVGKVTTPTDWDLSVEDGQEFGFYRLEACRKME